MREPPLHRVPTNLNDDDFSFLHSPNLLNTTTTNLNTGVHRESFSKRTSLSGRLAPDKMFPIGSTPVVELDDD